MNILNVQQYITKGNCNGTILEASTGTLIQFSYTSTLSRSTDGGRTWSVQYTFPIGICRTRFIDSRGYMYAGNLVPAGTTPAILVRSTDDGITWVQVATSSSSAIWKMTEDDNGNVYFGEYSAGLADTTELYGYGVWRSTDGGASFTKWYDHSHQSTQGAKDNVRHMHMCDFIDGEIYIGYGDTGAYIHADTGRNFRLNMAGAVSTDMGVWGNGTLFAVKTDDGHTVHGGDLTPKSIYKYDPVTNTKVTVFDSTQFGPKYGGPFYHGIRSNTGVLYTRGNAEGGGAGVVMASVDDGDTWHELFVQNNFGAGTDIAYNDRGAESWICIANQTNNYSRMKDFTKAELARLINGGRREV